MDEKYLLFKNLLAEVVSEAKSIIENELPNSFEDRQAYRSIQQTHDEIDTLLDNLEYMSKPAIEGVLHEMDNEKFELIDRIGNQVAYFSCGSRIEVYDPVEKKWHLGRVEHKSDNDISGYYFCCRAMEHPFLQTGMRARIRRSSY